MLAASLDANYDAYCICNRIALRTELLKQVTFIFLNCSEVDA